MKKKIIVVLLSVLLVLTISGCGKEDPIERLEESFERSLEMETASQSFDMDVFLDFSEATPELEMAKNMLDGMNISGEMDMNQENMSFAGDIKIDLNGMAYQMELYRGEEYFIKTPFSPNYIIIANKEEAGEMFNTEFIEDFSKDINNLIFTKLSNENTIAEEEVTIEQNGESVKVTPIAVSLTEEEAKVIFKEMMEFMFNSPEFRDQMEDNMKKQLEATEGEASEEEVEEMYNEALAEMDNVFNSISEGISLKKMDFVYYLDSKNDIRRSDVDYSMDVDVSKITEASIPEDTEDAETEMLEGLDLPIITIQLTGTSDIYNINNVQEIVIPELTEENSNGIEGMMGLPVQ